MDPCGVMEPANTFGAMSTHATASRPDHLSTPLAGARAQRGAPRGVGLLRALAAGLAAGGLIIWVTDLRGVSCVLLAVGLGLAGALAAAWTVPPAERGRPVLVRRHRTGHAAGAVLAIAMVMAVLGQAVLDGLSALDALLLAGAAVMAAVAVTLALGRMGRPRRALIVGTGEVAHHLMGSLSGGRRGFEVVGVVDDTRLPARDDDLDAPRLGCVRDIDEVVRANDVDLVIFAFVGAPDRELREAVRRARAAGAEVAVVSRLFEGLQGSLSLRRLEGLPVVVAGPQGPSRGDAIAQRATDILLSGVLLVLAAPLWAVLAAAIRIESPGPVLYRAKRIGRFERPFHMLKFRKMYDGAAGPALTMDDDERFTRMGRFLAHSKLDELPQLWNVLKGEMSLVGPRPEDARYVAAHPEAYREVLRVRPGITGLSQIRYRREFEHLVGEDFEAFYLQTLLPDKLAIDKYYASHQTWLLNVKVLVWTAVALLRGGELHLSPLASHVAFRQTRRSTRDLSRAA